MVITLVRGMASIQDVSATELRGNYVNSRHQMLMCVRDNDLGFKGFSESDVASLTIRTL